ncbi:MAG: peptidogalycan biosysnthesis protein, partial [Candidatus Omnitrophica bacterium]|nr:peptidogalycan biosysnthesis protein [Candidatus Omnitrophota bacterium]
MKKIDSELSFSITKAITDIPKQDWDDLFGRELIESYGYLKTMEENGVEKFSFRYLLGKRGGRTVFILPLFIVDFSFTMLVPEYFYRIARKFSRWLSMKVLFLGSPTTEGFSMGFTDDENFDAILDQALKKLTAYSKEEKIKGILFYNLSPKHGRLAGYLKKKKFLKMETLPTTIINIKTNSLEEYIADLGKNTRKDLKKKLRRSQGLAQLKTELREDITDIIDEIYKLYLNNFNDADVHFEILTKEFF